MVKRDITDVTTFKRLPSSRGLVPFSKLPKRCFYVTDRQAKDVFSLMARKKISPAAPTTNRKTSTIYYWYCDSEWVTSRLRAPSLFDTRIESFSFFLSFFFSLFQYIQLGYVLFFGISTSFVYKSLNYENNERISLAILVYTAATSFF